MLPHVPGSGLWTMAPQTPQTPTRITRGSRACALSMIRVGRKKKRSAPSFLLSALSSRPAGRVRGRPDWHPDRPVRTHRSMCLLSDRAPVLHSLQGETAARNLRSCQSRCALKAVPPSGEALARAPSVLIPPKGHLRAEPSCWQAYRTEAAGRSRSLSRGPDKAVRQPRRRQLSSSAHGLGSSRSVLRSQRHDLQILIRSRAIVLGIVRFFLPLSPRPQRYFPDDRSAPEQGIQRYDACAKLRPHQEYCS